jgi:uncharacterized protein YqiB (DUF1249 family)
MLSLCFQQNIQSKGALLSRIPSSQIQARIRRKKRYKVDLPAQIVECEMNYHRLLRLLCNVKELAVGNTQHYVVGDHPVSESNFCVTVLEQTKYTTVVHIAQLFSLQNTEAWIKNDDLSIGVSSANRAPMVSRSINSEQLDSTETAQQECVKEFLKSSVVKEKAVKEDVVKKSIVKEGVVGSAVYRGDVRLYHDASVAEVVKCQRYQSFSPRYEYPNVDMHQIDEKVQMNRFLGELLSHCLSHGRVAGNVMPKNT